MWYVWTVNEKAKEKPERRNGNVGVVLVVFAGRKIVVIEAGVEYLVVSQEGFWSWLCK